MANERPIRQRRRPSSPAQTFVIYERKTGAVRGLHHVVTGPPRVDTVLNADKQRRAAETLHLAVLRRAAMIAGMPTTRLATLRLARPTPEAAGALRVDTARRRLVRVRRAPGMKLSPLVEPRRRARR